MNYNIIVEPEALSDLHNIYDYILKQDSKNRAATFISELNNSIKSLEKMPYRCRQSHYVDDNNVRDLIYKNILLFLKS